MNELVTALSQVWGPSGHEARVREVIRGLVADCVDEIRVDAMGNLIVRKAAADDAESGGRRIMFAAHMDEIGLIITHVDKKGFMRFAPVGGVMTPFLPGQRVTFEDGTVGAIGLEKRKDRSKSPVLDELYVDVGAKSREDVSQQVGDMASFRHGVDWSSGRPLSPNHDDRIGCAVLVEALRRLEDCPNEIVGVFTVQEEIGLRGAATSAYGVAPDIAIAIDVTGTGDTPEAPTMEVALGKGPAIKVKDGGMIAHRGLRALLEARAAEIGQEVQLEVLTGGTTDAMAMQTSRGGVAAGAVSIPSRYVHAPSQFVDMDDVEGAVRLLVALAKDSVEAVFADS